MEGYELMRDEDGLIRSHGFMLLSTAYTGDDIVGAGALFHFAYMLRSIEIRRMPQLPLSWSTERPRIGVRNFESLDRIKERCDLSLARRRIVGQVSSSRFHHMAMPHLRTDFSWSFNKLPWISLPMNIEHMLTLQKPV